MTDAPTPRDVGAASLILEMNKWHGAYPAFSEAQAYMDAILSALTAAGYVVVPREPTREMVLAAMERDHAEDNPPDTRGGMYYGIYRAMIAAAIGAVVGIKSESRIWKIILAVRNGAAKRSVQPHTQLPERPTNP